MGMKSSHGLMIFLCALLVLFVLVASGSNISNSVVIARGTVAMPTSAIGSNTCSATVTVAAVGVLTTDAIDWSYNAAVAVNPGELVVNTWATAGNVNFNYCDPASGGVTPVAATLNWRVIR
jgi:hypothetical protein